MVGVVQADADEFSGSRHAGADARLAGRQRQRAGIESRKGVQRPRIDFRAGDIHHVSRQVADFAVRVDQARTLRARFSIPNQFQIKTP
jgi:hypothetical protein